MAEGFLIAGDACSFDNKCTCSINRIDCSYRYLTAVSDFSSYHKQADYIGLNFNFITSVPANAFVTLFSASSRRILIRLDNNRINSVDVDAFKGIPTNVSVDIYLNNNNLQTIPSALEKIGGLSSLYVQNNPLTNIDVLSIVGPSLSFFSVSLSKFRSWPTQLQNLTRVVHLTLDRSSMSINVLRSHWTLSLNFMLHNDFTIVNSSECFAFFGKKKLVSDFIKEFGTSPIL